MGDSRSGRSEEISENHCSKRCPADKAKIFEEIRRLLSKILELQVLTDGRLTYGRSVFFSSHHGLIITIDTCLVFGQLIAQLFIEMSRHEGVSCDGCLKSNFKGKRYKCLRCYDYDLCANCYESGAANSRHTPDHPVQCILSRSDYDLYYGGESSTDQAHSLTCPVCGRFGFTESELHSHVTAEHQNCNTEVVCPICASVPGGEPNLVTDDFTAHLTLEHRQQPHVQAEDAPSARHSLRRVQQPSRTLGVGRGRRPNMHFSSGGLSPSGAREVDPIAELLSQLSGVRRAAVPYDRLLHRHGASGQQSGSGQGSSASGSSRRSVFPPPPTNQAVILTETALQQSSITQEAGGTKLDKYQFLLDKCLDSQRRKDLNPDQSLFLQDLLLATMCAIPNNIPVHNEENKDKMEEDNTESSVKSRKT
ncbi:unnamed protein product [Allacma fusca]|uniref:RING-type E3 ubiquitin transferase n=1 Tax=Allacma fusca TaxID=39272 RepID=A0A8J2LLZ7_9HEXA|nr:unnamed protein product [Allacma fusca]